MEQYLLQIVLGVLSALVLFIYGIENLSKELNSLASDKFRTLISKLSSNRFTGAFSGALSTAIIQSSSAVTVLTVLLVNSGVISFKSSLGIMFGSNVGTTVTAQLALIQSDILPPVLIVLGFILKFWGDRFRLISKPIFFLGFILFALNILSDYLEPLQNHEAIINFFGTISSPLLAYTASAIFTMIVQSSSVTSGLIVILTQSGLIPIEVAIPMIIGSNLGSSAKAGIFAFFPVNLYAKRAGVAKFVFNLLGTGLFMFLLTPFSNFIQTLSTDPASQAALAHLIFNILICLIFLIVLGPFEKLINFLVKGEEEEVLFETKYLGEKDSKSVKKRFSDIRKELGYSLEITKKIYQRAISAFHNPGTLIQMEIDKFHELNNYLDNEITDAIVDLSKFKLSTKNAKKTIYLVKISNSIEQLGDLGKDFSEVMLKVHKTNIPKRDVDIGALTTAHNLLMETLEQLKECVQNPTKEGLLELKEREVAVHKEIQRQYNDHVEKLQTQQRYAGNIFVDAIAIIEQSVAKIRNIRRRLEKQIKVS